MPTKAAPELTPALASTVTNPEIEKLRNRIKQLWIAVTTLALISLVGLIWLVVLTVKLPDTNSHNNDKNCGSPYSMMSCPMNNQDNRYR